MEVSCGKFETNMASDEEYLRMQYFYNGLIEFMYFIIIYIESHGFIFLATLSKHVKFFKEEVEELLSSFVGDTLEEKLRNFLITMDCFAVSDNRVQATEMMTYMKNSLFEDLILSKTVDLALRGCTNLKDVCKNLNFNNVISIDEKNLLGILKKSTHFSIETNQMLSFTLLHFHGILGFEGYSCNFVICYFQNILQHCKTLSLDEIVCHSKYISSCGNHNMLHILCILYCSGNFTFENGQIMLHKKSKKYPKQKPFNIDLLNRSSSKTATMHVEQIVLSVYGPHIWKWTGEIGFLNESYGYIYCVTDFTNGDHGVFRVYFNKSALKLISEISNLKEYIQIRDVVRFDAKRHSGEKFSYWKATGIKIMNTNRFDYNESLFDELRNKSEALRKKCVGNTAAFNAVKDNKKCFHVSDTDLIKIQHGTTESISNFLLLDYLFVFGHVVMLMANMGMAICMHGNKIRNILFTKNSIYPLSKSANLFIKGQKIFALIPYIEKIDTVAVASFVYGLSDDETENFLNPEEFAKQFLPSIHLNSIHKPCDNCCGIVNSLTFQPDHYAIDLQLREQLFKLHKLVMSHCRNSVSKIRLFGLWNAVIREHFKTTSSENIVSFIGKLARSLKKNCCARQKLQVKCRRKLKRFQTTSSSESGMQRSVPFSKNFKRVPAEESVRENPTSNNLSVKSKSLDFSNASFSSLSSYKSFNSTNSSETFYSCESKEISSDNNTISLCSDKLNYKERTNLTSHQQPLLSLTPKSNDKFSFILENLDKDDKYETNCKNVKNKYEKKEKTKYFCMQSFPFLKHMFGKKKKRLCTPNSTRNNCDDCYKDSFKETAIVSLITDTFVFYNVDINGYSIVLPLPRRIIPEKLKEKIKLNSYSEIMVVPNTLSHLSHILSVNITA